MLKGVGVYLKFKLDKKLFSRYTANATESHLTGCHLADNTALLTRTGVEAAMLEYLYMAEDFGLSVSILETKTMVVE